MKKIALIIAAIMLISLASVFCVSAAGETAWDGTVATGYAGGNGTEGNPYQISNAAEWAYFATQINGLTQVKDKTINLGYFTLTADIVFNTGDASTWGITAPAINLADVNGVSYIVGDSCKVNPFVGTLDGNGHTISGVYMSKEGGTVGLFGSTAAGNAATIKNLVVTNSYFDSPNGEVGTLVGQTSGGTTTIQNVFVSDSVYIAAGNKYVGGFIGHNGGNDYGNPKIIFRSCVNAATVNASNADNVGGFLGNVNQKEVEIINCLNMGDISGKRYVGGMLGWALGKEAACNVNIDACVNVGKISSTTSSEEGKSCAIACVNNNGTKTVTNCYYLDGSATFGVYRGKDDSEGVDAVSIIDLCKSTLPSKLDSSAWIARGTGTTYDICLPKGVATFAPAIEGYNIEVTPDWLKDYAKTSVFEIDSVQKFIELAKFVNNAYPDSGDFDGKTVKLTADLTFNTGDASTWGENAPANDMTEYVIGSWKHPFCGTFDGNEKTISGFYAKKSAGDGDTVAIIGCTAYGKSATVKNLVITNSYFESAEGTVAACVAQTEGGTTTITGIYVSNSVYVVSAGHYAGGIIAHVGQGSFETPTAIIDGCVNAATVTANGGKNGTCVGGILGNGNAKIVKITNCLNMGDITGYQYVSGILGNGLPAKAAVENITISECVNVGVITARYSDSNNGKACAIVCFGDATKATLTASNCLYVKGTAPFGVYEKGDDGLSAKTITAGSDIIGLDIPNFLISELTEWTKRDGQIIIPTAVAEFAPAADDYAGEVITEPETEPVTEPVTEPTTDPVTEPVTEPATEAPETKKPVETKAPETSSGGCGGFTVVATAILVAVAGFSTAIVIKQR